MQTLWCYGCQVYCMNIVFPRNSDNVKNNLNSRPYSAGNGQV